MWHRPSIALLLAVLSGLWTGSLAAQEKSVIELSAPRALTSNDAVEIQIATGPLPAGARLVVMTEQGEVIGAITPYGIPGTPSGSTATIPVPPTALVDRRLRLQLQVIQPGTPPRAPRTDEVRRIDLIVAPRKE
jgi:hypothetical protein